MSFKDLLSKPLASKSDPTFTYESGESDLTNKDINELSGNDVDEAKPLTAEETEKVDNAVKRLATPIIVDDILGEDEIAVFKESADIDIACDEEYFSERTIVKFDKHARRRQLKKVAIFAIAKERKDPLYKKLNTIWKIERNLEAKLYKKYGTQADARVREYISNAKKSKSSTIKSVAKKMAA